MTVFANLVQDLLYVKCRGIPSEHDRNYDRPQLSRPTLSATHSCLFLFFLLFMLAINNNCSYVDHLLVSVVDSSSESILT